MVQIVLKPVLQTGMQNDILTCLRRLSDGKAEIDDERIQAYRGTVSLPFDTGEHRRVAVKIVDDRGIESLKIIALGTKSLT